MPSQIKYFWWISIALALFWSGFAAMDTLVALSGANEALHPAAYRIIQFVHLTYTIAIWAGIVILAGWLVSVRRKGWARLLFIGAILARLAIPVLLSTYYYGSRAFVPALLQSMRFEPRTYLTVLLLVAGTLLAFSSAATRWLNSKGTQELSLPKTSSARNDD